jgi:hypothetical protein
MIVQIIRAVFETRTLSNKGRLSNGSSLNGLLGVHRLSSSNGSSLVSPRINTERDKSEEAMQ